MSEIPVLIIGFTVCTYWLCVGAMIVRVRRQARGVHRVLVPALWIERVMWIVWVPLVLGWMTIPFISISSAGVGTRWIGLPPALASSLVAHAIRLTAALVGIVCLLLSMWCWQHMGRDWRMGVDPSQQSRLLVNGPFAKVRHPIYGLSILLMLCSVVVLPTPIMAILAAVHIGLMLIKARNEERFLLERHGQIYADYRRHTGRFVPSLRRGYKVSAGQHTDRSRESKATGRPPLTGVGATRFNSFQKSMLLWEEAYPYNAVHALRISGAADVPALRRIIEQLCRQAGLGELDIDRETQSYRYLELQSVPVMELPPSPEPEKTLAQVIDSGMNSRFPEGPSHPLRWTVFDEADGHAHYVVLVYRHIASDASGIEALLAAMLRQYLGREEPEAEAPLSLTPPPGTLAESAARGMGSKLAGFVRGLALGLRFQHMHKMPDEKEMGDETAVVTRTFPEPAFGRLSATCKARGVGINDAFVAALASAIAERTPHRKNRKHRHKLALGTVASTRRKDTANLRGYFGVCLSDMMVLLDSPDDPMDGLVGQVAAQTRALKTNLNPQTAASALQGFFVRHVWPLLDIPNHRRSYRKILPICGGVTTFIVDASRLQAGARAVTRYLRAGPPGPAVPIVLAPTVFAGHLELSLVHRLCCLSPDKAEDLLKGVCDGLLKLSGDGEQSLASSRA